MYHYRRLSPRERAEILAYRRLMAFPLHEPPHFVRDNALYLLTAATVDHAPILQDEERRLAFARNYLDALGAIPDTRIFAWVIQPTHHHALLHVDIAQFRKAIGRLHNRTSTVWNREDGTPGRAVWYRFADRGIRNERHFWAALNYIHANPVRHGYVATQDAWRCSSIHLYLDEYGEEQMRELAQAYPTLDFGKGWDW